MTLTPRFAFVPRATREQYGQEKWPRAVNYGNYKVISYDSPTQSEEVKATDISGLTIIKHDVCTVQMILDGIANNEQKIFNCSLEVAQQVAASFNKELT